ncbi:MAG: hypothetical protein PHS73_01980 [Candidatus Peribacteraceae bacterium]|nr:hypothetical protein [Candidatus Peribacteraceae bacterium]
MVLLLTGATEMSRGVIVDRFLTDHPDWRHLALEDLNTQEDEDDVIGMGAFFALLIACECAKEALKEGYNVVITCPSADMIQTVEESFPKELKSVYLGRSQRAAERFDHTIDTRKQSVGETCSVLHKLVA